MYFISGYPLTEWECTLHNIFMMNGESLISSLHHKPSSHKHTSVRGNILVVHFQFSTEPSSVPFRHQMALFSTAICILAVVIVVLKTLLEPFVV